MEPDAAPGAVTESVAHVPKPRRVHRIRLFLTILILLIAALVIPFRIRVNRTQVMTAMSRALGREVSFNTIHYRLLPWPGFSIEGFTVADDPAFSPEPVIHADSVTADIRMASLWRGRLEISRIRLQEPSLNVVRNAQGQWNLETILLRAAQIPSAPTNKKTAEQRIRFPYIEANGGRINLRLGNEKKPLTLMDSDFVLWLGSENRWNLAFSARPTRTDMNLTDLGIIRGNGVIQRADSLSSTPLNLHLSWDYAQLGQTTKLIFGQDKGWRSGVALTAELDGTPNDLAFTLRLALDGFRRADILPSGALTLAGICSGHAHYGTASISPLHCTAPLGTGMLAMEGALENLHSDARPDLRISTVKPSEELRVTAEKVPASALLEVFRRMKQFIPEDLQASGNLDAEFVTANNNASPEKIWRGKGILSGFELSSSGLNPPLVLGDVRFEKGAEAEPTPSPRPRRRAAQVASTPSPGELNILPISVDLVGTAPAKLEGKISGSNMTLRLQGPAQLSRLLAVGTALGMRTIRTNAEGTLQTDLALSGKWQELIMPALTGTATIEKLHWQGRQLNAPVNITGGTITLTPDSARVSDLSIEVGKNLELHGDLGFQRGCSPITDCSFRFQFTTPALSSDVLNQLLNPTTQGQGFRLFAASPQPLPWNWLRAQGSLATDQVQLGKLPLHRCSSFVSVAASVVSLQNLHCQALRGEHTGEWTMDFSGEQPKFSGQGKLAHAAIADAAALFHEDWGSGTIDIEYNLRFFGKHVPQFASSAEGSIKSSIQNGVWKHARMPHGSPPLQFGAWQMPIELSGGKMKVDDGVLKLQKQSFTVNGTIGLDRSLNLDFLPSRQDQGKDKDAPFHAEGTVQSPSVNSVIGSTTRRTNR